jgi:DNA-binding transcriptional LysR family regulator
MFERHLLKQGIHNFQTMELWSIEAMKQIVMSGIGFSALPYITVKEHVENGKLKVLTHSENFEPIYSHMLIKKKKWLSPAVEAFTELVLKSFSKTEKGVY